MRFPCTYLCVCVCVCVVRVRLSSDTLHFSYEYIYACDTICDTFVTVTELISQSYSPSVTSYECPCVRVFAYMHTCLHIHAHKVVHHVSSHRSPSKLHTMHTHIHTLLARMAFARSFRLNVSVCRRLPWQMVRPRERVTLTSPSVLRYYVHEFKNVSRFEATRSSVTRYTWFTTCNFG